MGQLYFWGWVTLALAIMIAESKPPNFSWDTIPYFVHCSNASGAVNDAVLDLQAKAGFTVIQVQQGMNSGGQLCLDEHNTSRCNSTHAEEKMAAAAARIRSRNANAVTILYYTVDNVRVESDLGRWFLTQPDLILQKNDEYVYDWSNPATVTAWANGVAAMVHKGGFDGVFIDGYAGWYECEPGQPGTIQKDPLYHPNRTANTNHRAGRWGHVQGCPELVGNLHAVPWGPNRTTNTTAFLRGLWLASGPALKAALPADAVMIPNCEGGYGCRDGNGSSRIPGYTAVMEEFFGESHFGNGLSALPNHTVDGDDESIQSLAQMGARGTLAEINWTDNKDVDGAVLGLAAFLVGASLNQFYGAIGWYWNCREIPVATLAPLVSKKLGEPLGAAKSTVIPLPGKPGQFYTVLYRRQFAAGVSIFLNVSNTPRSTPACCIRWSDATSTPCNPGDCNGSSVV